MNDTPESPLRKRLVYTPNKELRYPSDVDRLVQVARDAGYELSEHDAAQAWEEYSDMFAAGWLYMQGHEDDELLSILKGLLHEC